MLRRSLVAATLVALAAAPAAHAQLTTYTFAGLGSNPSYNGGQATNFSLVFRSTQNGGSALSNLTLYGETPAMLASVVPTGTTFNIVNVGGTPNSIALQAIYMGSTNTVFTITSADLNGYTFGHNVTTVGGATDAVSVGQAVGYTGSSIPTGSLSFAAQVVPEPSTYALLGAGLLGLGSMARRRRTVTA